jgi:hypothetical protein
MSKEDGEAGFGERGRELIEEAEKLRVDIDNAVRRSIIHDTDPPCLPMIAGSSTPFDTVDWRAAPESFDQSRTYSELMHSGVLSKDTVELILRYCSAHTGTRLGILSDKHRNVGKEECIQPLGFRVYGQAYGLLQHDMIREFLLFYYAHVAHLHTRGTWTAFESVDLDRARGAHAPYCGPAQLTIPALTKWMLVFEDPIEDRLWLAKATPRAYLEHGKHISVADAPTRWGRIGYRIESWIDNGEVQAVVDAKLNRACRTVLRLRVPGSAELDAVTVNGREWQEFSAAEETVDVPTEEGRQTTIVARYKRR